MRLLKLVLEIALAWGVVSCSSVITSSKTTALSTNYCAPSVAYVEDTVAQTGVFPDTLVSKRLSAHDYTLANYLGLLPLFSQFAGSATPLEKLEARQKIAEKILLFQTEINAVASELDCNGERFDQLRRFLGERNAKVNTRLTVASIVTGAAIVLSTVFVKNDNINTGINIGGGITAAGLGFMMLNPKGEKIKLENNRSLLKNVWWGNNTDLAFPPTLWRAMNEKSFSNRGEMSLIQTLRERWLVFVFGKKVGKPDEQLYFGSGGYFSENSIQNLSDMNNEL